MAKKLAILILRIIVTAAAVVAAVVVLYRFEFFSAGAAPDNIVGMLPVVLAVAFVGGITAIAWMKHSKRRIPVAATLAVMAVLSAALYPTALTGNWWIHSSTRAESDAGPDLTLYAPFSENSKLARLDGQSTLKFEGDLPVLDGATALYPVYAAFAQAVYGREAFDIAETKPVLCTNTRGAYEAVTKGARDIIFVAGASDAQKAAAKAAGAELVFTPVGLEAFVFVAGKTNPIDNLTSRQIRNIYSGKTAYWGTLGWREGGRIVAYQRPEGSGSQTGLQSLMGNLPIQAPQPMPIPDDILIGSNSLMAQVSMEWNGGQPALGYSYRYYATTMYANLDAKLLSTDGFAPTSENIRNGSYPFVNHFYAVTLGKPTGNVKLLIDWILEAQGQELIEKTGYTGLENMR